MMSPDENAVAVAAQRFGQSLTMRVPFNGPSGFAWLHPRSFISKGDGLVPVGFLGLPIIFGVLQLVFGTIVLGLVVPLLVVSVTYPLLRFTSGWRMESRLLMIVTWLSFPMVVTYANRSLYPNLNVVCLTIWSAYLLWERRTTWRCLASGVLFGLALSIRPIELIWMIPWMWLAWRSRRTQRNDDLKGSILVGVGASLVCLFAAFIAYRTYGSPFVVGYLLHDPVTPGTAVTSSGTPSSIWPFGFHPMHVWFNIKNYFGGYLWPWMILTIFGIIVAWKQRKHRRVIVIGVWTVCAVVLLYGQAVYQDHVGLNVTSVGNSFLRYVLPIAPVVVFAIGSVSEWLFGAIRVSSARFAVLVLAIVLFGSGIWTAYARDDDGLLQTRRQQLQNAMVLDAVTKIADPSRAVILSDRDDKTFFPEFRASSPLPSEMEMQRLVNSNKATVYLYTRTFDDATSKRYQDLGINGVEVMTNGRESMYLLFSQSDDEGL